MELEKDGAMAKVRKEEKPKVEIKSTNALIAIFQRLVDATNRILAAAQKRDQAKNKADEEYEAVTTEDQALLEELDGAAIDYVIEHRKELLPADAKSAIVGPVTVEFRYGNPVLRDSKGKEPRESTILLALDEAIHRARGPNKELLEACIERKPKLKKQVLKELPEELLTKLGLTLVQVEQVSWKANADR